MSELPELISIAGIIHAMTETVVFILSLSIGISAIIGIARFRKMDPAYHPFIYFATIATIIEIVNFTLLENKMYTAFCIVTNLYGLTEFFLFTSLFHRWGLFKSRKNLYFIIIGAIFLLWLITLFIRGYQKMNYPFFIIMSFVIIFLTLSAFNRMVVNDRRNIFSNPKFWICIGIIIFYTYFILSNTVSLTFPNTEEKSPFNKSLFAVRVYSNLFVNLLYAIAVIWIPRKKNIMTLF